MKILLIIFILLLSINYVLALDPSISIVNVPSNNTSNQTNQSNQVAQGSQPTGTQGAAGGGGGALPQTQGNIQKDNQSQIQNTSCQGQDCTPTENQTSQNIIQNPQKIVTYPINPSTNKLLLIALPILILVFLLVITTFVIVSEKKQKPSKPL